MTKDERQDIAINNWRNAAGKGGFMFPTGFGKTTTGVKIINRMVNKNPALTVLVVVPSDDLRTAWSTKLTELNVLHKVITIHEQQRNPIIHEISLLILDEVSSFYSDDRQNIWNGTWVKAQFTLWLDATPKTNPEIFKKLTAVYPVVDVITLEEAEQNNWISPVTIYNVEVLLTDAEKYEYDTYSEVIAKYLSKFDNNLERAMKCLSGVFQDGQKFSAFQCCTAWAIKMGWQKEYPAIISNKPADMSIDVWKRYKDIDDNWNPSMVLAYAKEAMKYITLRKKIVYKATNKIQAVLNYVIKHETESIIIFGKDNTFADIITKTINDYYNKTVAASYHSTLQAIPLRSYLGNPSIAQDEGELITIKSGANKGLPKYFGASIQKQIALNELNTGRLRILVTADSLNKGVDAPIVSVGITTAVVKTAGIFTQRRGRTNRYVEDKQAIMYCLFCKDTIEKNTLKQAQKDLNGDDIHFIYNNNEDDL